MEVEGNIKIYFDTVMDEMNSSMDISGMDEEHRKEVGEAILNTAFDREGPRAAEGRADDKMLFIANKLFRPFSEIFNNVEAIENVAIYAGSFPYKKHGVSQLDYLKYHIENYLNEIYILKNRIISHLTLIERAYRKCDRIDEIHKFIEPLYGIVSRAFEGYVNVRGAHVHQNRYTDDDFDRLTNLNLLSMSGDDEFSNIFRSIFLETYRATRRKWVGRIKKDVKSIEEILEMYCEALVNSIIKDGKIVYPSNTNWV